jgi:hypothetical protein
MQEWELMLVWMFEADEFFKLQLDADTSLTRPRLPLQLGSNLQ